MPDTARNGWLASRVGVLSCLICGHGFRPSGRRVFCSPACRQRAFRLRHPHRTRLPNKAIITPIEIPPKHDPRLVDGTATQRQRLAQLNPAQRSALVLERYPELGVLPSCDWRRLSVRSSFSVLFGESAHN
jgi:hypothetical protein